MARVELPTKDEVPSNNEKDKKVTKPKKKEAWAEARAAVKAGGGGSRRKKSFVEEGAEEMRSFVIDSVVMPTVKEMVFNVFSGIFDIFKDAIEARIFGVDDVVRERNYRTSYDRRRTRSYRDRSSIDDMFDRGSSRSRSRGGRGRSRDVTDYDDFYFTELVRADCCLNRVFDIFEDNGCMLRVSEYKKLLNDEMSRDEAPYDISNIDYEWGWYSLSNANVKPLRGGGFKIDMPKPRPLDD